MKKYAIPFAAIFAFALVVLATYNPWVEKKSESKPVITVTDITGTTDLSENILPYATYNGSPVEIYKAGGKLAVRVALSEYWSGDEQDSALNFLTNEVERLTTGQLVELGATGYTFQFTDGNPIWGPYTSIDCNKGSYSCLQFAENVTWENRQICADGGNYPIPTYYPYHKKSS